MAGRMYSFKGLNSSDNAENIADPLVRMAYVIYIERKDTLNSMRKGLQKTEILAPYLELEKYLLWLYTTNFTNEQWVEYMRHTYLKPGDNDD